MEHIRSGDLDAAVLVVETVSDPVMARKLRGRIALRRHDWLGAHDYFCAAVDADRDDVDAMMCLGMAQFELGGFERAARTFEAVILRKMDLAKAWLKLAACHAMMQQHAQALACFERAVGLTPDDPECHHGMATMCSSLGIEDGALHHYREAQRLNPDYVHAKVGEAATLLRMERWSEGWPLFEARWKLTMPMAPWWYRGQPLYDGDLDGLRDKRVLLRCEQGFGDSIHFARYVPLVAELASEVIVETQSELARLFACLPARIVVVGQEPTPEFDVQTSLMSLPLLFVTTPETCPPPLKIQTGKQDWDARIGICYSGGPRPEDPQANAVDRRRSVSWETFSLIGDAIQWPNRYVILHRDYLDMLTRGKCQDWYDTAAIVSGLDLVITVDTAIAHLAASLGVDTWMLSRFDACWRWGLTGETTPWYPSMRIFRQPRLGDWEPVIDRVVEELGKRDAPPS